MKQFGWFLGQEVSPSELAAGFTEAENADLARVRDFGYGVAASSGLPQQQGSPDLTISVPANSVYDKLGRRIRWGTTQTVDLSVDSSNVSTSVPTVGQSRKVSVFAKYKRALSNVRVDGNDDEVFYDQDESFEFVVVQGAAGVSPSLPALDSTNILLCDVTIAHSQTTIVNGDISTTRREKYSPQILGGTFTLTSAVPSAQVGELHTAINTLGAASGFAQLGSDGVVPDSAIAGHVIKDIAFYMVGTDHSGSPIFSANTSGVWTDTSALLTVPSCDAGDIVVLYFAVRANTTGAATSPQIQVTLKEGAGSATAIAGTTRTCQTGTTSEHGKQVPCAVVHTMAGSGDLTIRVQAISTAAAIAVYDVCILAIRLTP